MHLACVLLRLSMPEALVAATLNAAASLGKSDTHGSLEVGKRADMVLIDAPRYRAAETLVTFYLIVIKFITQYCLLFVAAAYRVNPCRDISSRAPPHVPKEKKIEKGNASVQKF